MEEFYKVLGFVAVAVVGFTALFIFTIHFHTITHYVTSDCGDELLLREGYAGDSGKFQFAQAIGYEFVEMRKTGEFQDWYVVKKGCG